MYIYKYISNLQTYNLRAIYCTFTEIAVSFRLFFLKFYLPPDKPTLNTLYTQLKPSECPHTVLHTHTHTFTLSASPVGILLYIIIRGGCTIKEARVQ